MTPIAVDTTFSVTAVASRTGSEHTRLGRNNQDGSAVRVVGNRIVGVVTDGCSQGRYSEVGARLGAAWLAQWLPLYRDTTPDVETLAKVTTHNLVGYLRNVAAQLSPQGRVDPDTVADYLLFTFLAALVEPTSTLVIGMGDGVIAHRDETLELDPGAENAPAYPAYRLLEPAYLHRPMSLTPHHRVYPGRRALLIGTDGARSLDPPVIDEVLRDPRYTRNPFALQRRLTVSDRTRRLHDDTTLVLIRPNDEVAA